MTLFKRIFLWDNMVCETLWLYSRKPTEVKALELIRAAVVACDLSKVRIVEEFSENNLRVFIEVVSREPCVDYLTPLLRYVLGDDVKVVASNCGNIPLQYASIKEEALK